MTYGDRPCYAYGFSTMPLDMFSGEVDALNAQDKEWLSCVGVGDLGRLEIIFLADLLKMTKEE